MTDESQLDQTQRLLGAVMGQQSRQTTRFEEVRKAFSEGKTDIVVELPWYPDGGTHQLILTRLAGDRVFFINPLGHKGQQPGAALSDGGLARKVEPDNTESALAADLDRLFKQGKAKALIPS